MERALSAAPPDGRYARARRTFAGSNAASRVDDDIGTSIATHPTLRSKRPAAQRPRMVRPPRAHCSPSSRSSAPRSPRHRRVGRCRADDCDSASSASATSAAPLRTTLYMRAVASRTTPAFTPPPPHPCRVCQSANIAKHDKSSRPPYLLFLTHGATVASAASFSPDACSMSLCRLFPWASIVTMAGKSVTRRCHIASGVPNSSSETPSTASTVRA